MSRASAFDGSGDGVALSSDPRPSRCWHSRSLRWSPTALQRSRVHRRPGDRVGKTLEGSARSVLEVTPDVTLSTDCEGTTAQGTVGKELLNCGGTPARIMSVVAVVRLTEIVAVSTPAIVAAVEVVDGILGPGTTFRSAVSPDGRDRAIGDGSFDRTLRVAFNPTGLAWTAPAGTAITVQLDGDYFGVEPGWLLSARPAESGIPLRPPKPPRQLP